MTTPAIGRRVIRGFRRAASAAAGVRWVQAALNRVLGTRLAVDGIAGPQTRSAVRAFQKSRGLAVDGIVGPRTRAALAAAGAGPGRGAGIPIAAGGPACPVPESQEIAWERANPAGRVDIASDGGLSVRILWNFAVGSAELKPEHLREIRGTGFRGRFGDRVIVEGHSSCSGAPDRRQRISEQRAAAVAAALRGVGFPREAIEVSGDSDRSPRAPNTTPEGMARNRRVEIRGGVVV